MSGDEGQDTAYRGSRPEPGSGLPPEGGHRPRKDARAEFQGTEGPGTTPEFSFSSTSFGTGSSSTSGRLSLPSTLFHCTRCHRLLETQYFRGVPIIPRYCAWCGAPAAPIQGREMDGYRIGDLIAWGGFGILYLASNVAEPKMKAVVKFLRPDMACRRPEFVEIFVEEARLTEEIARTCWNVVRVSNVRERPWPYFFMEYLRGITLEETIRRAGSKGIPIEECKGYLRGIARALAATHVHGRVHRDLKPSNIMVIQSQEVPRPEDRIKLLDFGLALRIAGAAREEAAVPSRALLEEDSPMRTAGTLEYMCPEAFDGVNEFQGDIYSFGVTAYETLTGTPPWLPPDADSDRFSAWKEIHRNVRPAPVRAARPEAPAWLSRVVQQCLEKDPRKRIRSAEELLEKLREPLPGWVWMASAAALLLLAFLARLALRPEVTREMAGWDLDGRFVRGGKATLYARGPDDLAERGRSILAVLGLPGERPQDFSWSSDGPIGLEPSSGGEEGRLRLRFSAATSSALRDGDVLHLEGRKGGLWKAVKVTGSIEVRFDAGAPRLSGEYFLWHAGIEEPLRLADAARIRSKVGEKAVRLLVEIGDESPVSARFRLTRLEMELTRHEIARRDFWGFSVAEALAPGSYSGWVEAVDGAGNRSTGEKAPISFTVDDRCEFELSNVPLLDGGKAFFQLVFGEPLQEIAVIGRERRARVAFELFPAEGISSSLQLARKRDEGLTALEFEELRAGEKYLLAVETGNEPKPGEKGLVGEIVARDTCIPVSQEFSRRLEVSMPRRVTLDDIKQVYLQLRGEDAPGQSAREFLARSGSGSRRVLHLKSSGGKAPAVILERISITVKQGQFHRAACRWGDEGRGKGMKGQVGLDEIVFAEPLDLRADVDQELEMSFEGPSSLLEAGLLVRPDTVKPEVVIALSSGSAVNPRFHDVEDGGGILAEVTASEPLTPGSVAAFVDDKSRTEPLTRVDDLHFRLETLQPFDIKEGPHTILVRARDLAGHEGEGKLEFIINHRPPRIAPLSESLGQDGRLHLGKSEKVLFRAEDLSGVCTEDASMAYRCRDERGEETTGNLEARFSESREQFPDRAEFELSLEDLPEACTGVFLPRVRDRCGRVTGQEEAIPFEYRRVRQWAPVVSFRGVNWILIEYGDKRFYMSATEISNKVFRAAGTECGFLGAEGSYADPRLHQEYGRPKYWGPGGEFPTHYRGGADVPGDEFPVAGISPEEAEEFAARAFKGRLPALDEWRGAATLGDPDRRFPWKDGEKGKDWINCYTPSPSSRIKGQRGECMVAGGKKHACRLVASDFIPYPKETARELLKESRSCGLLHQLGNVGELVRMREGAAGWEYGIAGGDFATNCDGLDLRQKPKPYQGDDLHRNYSTGFRLLIDLHRLDDVDPEFKKLARKS